MNGTRVRNFYVQYYASEYQRTGDGPTYCAHLPIDCERKIVARSKCILRDYLLSSNFEPGLLGPRLQLPPPPLQGAIRQPLAAQAEARAHAASTQRIGEPAVLSRAADVLAINVRDAAAQPGRNEEALLFCILQYPPRD